MVSPLFSKGLTAFLTTLGCCLVAAMPLAAANDDVALSEPSMTQAIGYMALLRGQDISADDGAWLRQQWREEIEASPQTVAAELDEFAVLLEHQQQTPDPMALANGRTTTVKNAYCAAEQTSAPKQQRLKEILAPDDVVIAADCVFGFVVTRFDVDGLVASHALTAAATGQSHDADRDRAEVVDSIESGFASASPQEKALVANGETRHAMFARFWSRIDGAPEQRAVIDEVRSAAGTDLRGTARQLEQLALSKVGEVDYLAEVGNSRLTVSTIGAYRRYLETIAGYSFTPRDIAWLQRAIIDEFRGDPAKALGEAAGIKDRNSTYARADDAAEKAALVKGWAATLYCYLDASSDPDEKHLAEVVFRHDPVTEADCQASRVSRRSDTVLAEADGQRLTERDLTVSKRFLSILLGRPLLPAEEAVVRDDSIQSFNEDLKSWNEEHEFFRVFIGKIENRTDSHFLAIDERKKLFDTVYCVLKKSPDTYTADYLQMFQRGGAILFEDCDRQLVTTRDEINAVISFTNFLKLVNERPPLSQAEVDELHQSLAGENLDAAESWMSAVGEWWSLLTLEEKAAEIENIKRNGITPEADSGTIASFVNSKKGLVVLKNVNLRTCKMMAIIAQGETAIYAARAGNISGQQYATLVTNTNMAAELCKGSGGGG